MRTRVNRNLHPCKTLPNPIPRPALGLPVRAAVCARVAPDELLMNFFADESCHQPLLGV